MPARTLAAWSTCLGLFSVPFVSVGAEATVLRDLAIPSPTLGQPIPCAVTLPDDFYLRSPLVLSPDGSRGIELGDNGVGGNNALRVIDLTGPAQSSPGSSAPSDPITGLLNLIGSVFVNQTPTLSPVVHRVDAANGVIVGNLGGHDAEGDKLVYTVTQQPLHGTVTIDQATGTWTYTATGPYGGDSFVIEASDGPGFHIHGIATLLTPGGGYTTTSTVNVFVPPI